MTLFDRATNPLILPAAAVPATFVFDLKALPGDLLDALAQVLDPSDR